MSQQVSWGKAWTGRIGKQVRQLRKAAGLSVQQLADRCTRLGNPIPRSTIANMENEQRSAVSVQEVAVLARALDVPPLRLLFDVTDGAKPLEVLPGTEVLPVEAVEWFMGGDNGPFTGQRELDAHQRARIEYDRQLLAAHYLREVQRFERLVDEVDAGLAPGDTDAEREFHVQDRRDGLDRTRRHLAHTLGRLGQDRRSMVAEGMTPPPLHEDLTDAYRKRMVELGYPDAP